MPNLESAYITFQGGGALGMAHLGAWQEVSRQFNIIGTAGTSAGSIVSALCAAGFNPAHTIDLFDHLNWAECVNPQSLIKWVGEQDAYSDGKRFHKWLREQLGRNVPGKPDDINFTDLYRFRNIYLAIIACDLNCQVGEPVVFDKDTEPHTTISFAVRASISIPGLFKPMPRLDRRQELVDGGLLLNFPVDLLYQRGKQENCALIGVRFKQPKKYLESPKVTEALKGTLNLMMRRGSLPPDYIAKDPNYIDIEIDVSGFNGLEFDLRTEQKKELVKRGVDAAKLALAEYNVRIHKQKNDLLEKNSAEVVSKIQRIVKLDKEADAIGSEIKSRQDSDVRRQLQEALDWLSKRDMISKRVGKKALDNFPELKNNEDKAKLFYEEIEEYLELIYHSLITERKNLLREPEVCQSLSNPSLYEAALDAVKNNIPKDLNPLAKREIEDRIDYLKERIK